jgi:Tol biopolymer transport system component
VPGGTWGTLSPNGRLMAYPSAEGIRVLDLETHSERVVGNGLAGYNLQWSPDGRQIAFVGEAADRVYVIGLDGSPARPISDQPFVSVMGWSSDGEVYVAIPFTGGSAWQVRAIDPAAGTWRDLFIIENGTRKFLSPALSPDGKWIAYRGADNSRLYVARQDGSDMHVIMDSLGQVLWSRSGWMGVTLLSRDGEQLSALLVQPETCVAYSLPALHGYLEALYMP